MSYLLSRGFFFGFFFGHFLAGYAVREVDQQGFPLLTAGYTVTMVTMDNCGFRHGRIAQIFHFVCTDLLFQSADRPEFNTCELFFKDIMKRLFKETYAENLTEIAKCGTVTEIIPLKSLSFYRKCGF